MRTRRSARTQAYKVIEDLDKKIRDMGSGKKMTIKRTLTRMSRKIRTRKEKLRKEEALKKKYGKFFETYKQLEPALTSHLAHKIITIAKDYDREQTRHKRNLKKLQTQRPKLSTRSLKLKQEREDLKNDLNIVSPTWRRGNISPHVLRNLTQEIIDREVRETRQRIEKNEIKQREVAEKLDRVDAEIKEVEGKIDK